jgi:hypothetical protein
MFFAAIDPETAALYAAITAVLVAVGNYIQSRMAKGQAHDGAKAGANAAVAPVLAKVNQVYESVNGTGITGALKRIEAEQKAHAEEDRERFGEIHKVVGMEPKAGG